MRSLRMSLKPWIFVDLTDLTDLTRYLGDGPGPAEDKPVVMLTMLTGAYGFCFVG